MERELRYSASEKPAAVIPSSRVGPAGGQVLVDRTVEALQTLWPAAK